LFFNPGRSSTGPRPATRTPPRTRSSFWGLIERGVYFPCSQFEALFISAAHTEADIDQTIAAAAHALKS
jgi:glutamate-1-semialdehyde 2,1-aminomutase